MQESLGYYGLILDGLWVTVQLTVAGCLVAALVAFGVGVGSVARSTPLRLACRFYILFFRGTSSLVQLFWAFYVLPYMGVELSPMLVGIAVLGLNVGSYSAEVVRAAILAVPREQSEAAVAINLSRGQRMRYVILPQALPLMLPSFGNNVVELMKMTAIVSLITLNELTAQAQAIRSATGETLMPYLAILVLYYLFSLVLTAPMKWLEKRFASTPR
ncbi:ectoine/hydroxyectoine ABC transporter permease subunit EhuC [Pseudomonas sp. RIT-PI-AD]|uniref:ectoine/hydroxyectoine ABC transporter permease subunit EhuC n=1 Tax=Pseudomonas sp. RIT-PI-AD TaxID=3035294 RepID=UPI0021D876F7|nr:ectoine/hydroxyectoine ABC transporter permease subunit EhuC [Pseudomonas sp. RIT-PI-AD]